MMKCKILIFFLILYLVVGCKEKQVALPFNEITTTDDVISEEIEVPFVLKGGVKYVDVTVNDCMGIEMILDTGCSGASISVAEAQYLFDKGCLENSDFIGVAQSIIANGEVEENMVVNLKKLTIGNVIECEDVEATVSNSISAPLLLGNDVFDRASSITIDNERNVIVFKIEGNE